MISIGLVGGVACGKSSVALDFQKLGAHVLDGDRIGHEVLQLDSVKAELVARWGSGILCDGQLERNAIARIVFGENRAVAAEELSFLESLTHPEIAARLAERLLQVQQTGRYPITVVDAAVMLKAGWDKMCERIVFVDAPRELRQQRARLRGLDQAQFDAREAVQLPVEEKKKRADMVIDNSGSPENTFRQVEQVWHSLLQIA